MATNIFDIQISNEKAFSLFKEVYGPARRQNSKGASEEDFQIACEILELCGVKLVKIEENVNVSTLNFKDSRVVQESIFSYKQLEKECKVMKDIFKQDLGNLFT